MNTSSKNKINIFKICTVILILNTFSSYAQIYNSEETLIIGAEDSYPPYTYQDLSGEATGFSVELLNSVLKIMNLDYQYQIDSWESVKESLEKGEIDILPLVGRTPERESKFDFTLPYLTMHGTIVVNQDTPAPQYFEELEGKRVAVMKGDNAEEYVRRKDTVVDIVLTETFQDALKQLSNGEVDAVVIQRLLALQIIEDLNIDNLIVSNNFLKDFSQSFCFAVTEGNKKLLEALNEGLAIVMTNGIFDKLQTDWFTNSGNVRTSKHKIIIGGDRDYPPYEFIDKNGEPAGYIVELTEAIAEIMDLNIEIELAPWNETYLKLQSGEIDMVQGLFYSQERDQEMDFSQAHSIINHVVVNRIEDDEIIEFSDLEDKNILVLKGDIMHEYLLEHELFKNIILGDSIRNILIRLAAGEGDCALIAQNPANYWIEKFEFSNLRVGNKSFNSPEYNYGALEENSALLLPFNEGLSVLKTNGEYRRIYSKWLGLYENEDNIISVKNLKTLIISFITLLLLMGFILLWSYSLKKQVRERTRELEISEKKFSTIFNNISSFVYVFKKSGHLLSMNKPLIRALGIESEDPEGIHISDSCFDNFFSFIELDRLQNTPDDFFYLSKDTSYFDKNNIKKWLHTELFDLENTIFGEPVIIGVSTDISERITFENELKESESRFKRAIDEAPVPILIQNEDGEFIHINKKWTEISGYSREEIPTRKDWIKKAYSLVPDEMDRHIKSLFYKEESINEGPFTITCANGDVRVWEFHSVTIGYTNNRQKLLMSVINDMTEIIKQNDENRKLHEQLLQKSKMDVVGQLAGGIAHDFNNVLNGIINAAQLLRKKPDIEIDKRNNYIDIIIKASERASSLSSKLLTFSRRQEVEFSIINLHSLIFETVEILSNTIDKKIHTTLCLEAENPFIWGDESEIHNSLLNVCINGCQAMKSGGTLTIKTVNKVIDEEYTDNSFRIKSGNYCQIEISDTGMGINEEDIQKIFEPFYTTKPVGEGTGLGLAAVYGSVIHHNGSIEVESRLNYGTTFRISLPASGQNSSIEKDIRVSEEKDLSGLVLFVDDEEINRMLGADLLESLGYKALIASSGLEAIELYKKNLQSIDVVIIDFMMPNMNGKETFEKIREIDAHSKIILASGFSENESIRQMRASGLNAELNKPYTSDDLDKILAEVIQTN